MNHRCLLILLLLPFASQAQSVDTTVLGNLTLIQEEGVSRLMNAKVVVMKPKTMPGFRVQIASSANRNEVQEMKTSFLRRYPNVRAYLTYQQPYFKLRVGDYEERSAAAVFMNEIYDVFPGFVVNDVINTTNEPESLETKNR